MDDGSDSKFSASSARNELASEQLQEWIREQEVLKSRLKLYDDFSWTLPPKTSDTVKLSTASSSQVEEGNRLRYVGGVDLSFSKTDSSVAIGALVVLDMDNMKVVYEDFDMVQLTMPYIPGFLAFRESPALLNLLKKMGSTATNLYPQLLMVDGNGILHPRGFGLASHLGVLADVPTIGVGKNAFPRFYFDNKRKRGELDGRHTPYSRFSRLDKDPVTPVVVSSHPFHPTRLNGCLSLGSSSGLIHSSLAVLASMPSFPSAEVRLEVSKSNLSPGDIVPLIGRSGRLWGVALKSHEGSTKPIFVSIGHRISLETATTVVQRCCHYRVPEPIRQADMRSRERLRLMNHEST